MVILRNIVNLQYVLAVVFFWMLPIYSATAFEIVGYDISENYLMIIVALLTAVILMIRTLRFFAISFILAIVALWALLNIYETAINLQLIPNA